MGIDAAKGEHLLLLLYKLFQCIVHKMTIVARVVVNSDSAFANDLFVCLIFLQCLSRTLVCYNLEKMINEDSVTLTPLIGKHSLELVDEFNLGGLKLVHQGTLPWVNDNKHSALIMLSSGVPGYLGHGTKKAANTRWGTASLSLGGISPHLASCFWVL